jgi:hypothetical protein
LCGSLTTLDQGFPRSNVTGFIGGNTLFTRAHGVNLSFDENGFVGLPSKAQSIRTLSERLHSCHRSPILYRNRPTTQDKVRFGGWCGARSARLGRARRGLSLSPALRF